MLQFIVGWRRFDNEDWANTMKRMNARLSSAMSQYLIASRIQQLRNRKFTLASTFASQSGWHTHTINVFQQGIDDIISHKCLIANKDDRQHVG